MLDFTKPINSYFLGLLYADGTNPNGKKRKICIELSIKDKDILDYLNANLEFKTSLRQRTRDTNFSKNVTSVILNITDPPFRDAFTEAGLSVGKKSDRLAKPLVPIIEADFIRGLYDGDGSLGLTGSGCPFLSFTTKSEELRRYVVSYLNKKIGYEIKVNRNKRDSVFNITIKSEYAQTVIKEIYYDSCIGIKRKKNNAVLALAWKRPEGEKPRPPKNWWTREQDAFVLSHDITTSTAMLNRSKSSVQTRVWRLLSGG